MVDQNANAIAYLYPTTPLGLDSAYYKHATRQYGSVRERLWHTNRASPGARPYIIGDPVRSIDWKAFARTETLIVREVQPETAAQVEIIVDCRDSMLWPDAETLSEINRKVPTKFECVWRLAMCLAYNHLKAQDIVNVQFVGLSTMAEQVIRLRSAQNVMQLYDVTITQGFIPEKIVATQPLHAKSTASADLSYYLSDGLNPYQQEIHPNLVFIHVLNALEIDQAWITSDVSYFDQVQIQSEQQMIEYPGTELLLQNRLGLTVQNWLADTQMKFEREALGYIRLTEQTLITVLQSALRHMFKQKRVR